ncbi:hypothetical protein D3C86_1383530 [compost metagenome]
MLETLDRDLTNCDLAITILNTGLEENVPSETLKLFLRDLHRFSQNTDREVFNWLDHVYRDLLLNSLNDERRLDRPWVHLLHYAVCDLVHQERFDPAYTNSHANNQAHHKATKRFDPHDASPRNWSSWSTFTSRSACFMASQMTIGRLMGSIIQKRNSALNRAHKGHPASFVINICLHLYVRFTSTASRSVRAYIIVTHL